MPAPLKQGTGNGGSMEYGTLNINVVSEQNNRPVEGARIRITTENAPDQTVEEASTDSQGQLNDIRLESPPLEYSMEPTANKPYSEYTIYISAPGFETVEVNGAEIFSGETAIQNVNLIPTDQEEPDSAELFVIPDHTLWGDYPPKIAESEIKTVEETGEIVLSRVVIPEYVVVHDGPPRDSRAKNYYVKYKDYIKNVASSEIYSTWPEATIQANVLAIQSFTLNRVYTEWYRNKGYDFTITTSTAYDHKWISGRNIFDSISRVVDEIFSNYLSRPNVQQPILTQYCDGKNVSCPNWMAVFCRVYTKKGVCWQQAPQELPILKSNPAHYSLCHCQSSVLHFWPFLSSLYPRGIPGRYRRLSCLSRQRCSGTSRLPVLSRMA